MCEFWYDYAKPKHGEKSKLCYMDIDSFIVYIKTGDIYNDIAKDVETRFDTSNCELDRPLPHGKIKKVIGLMKVELGEKIIIKFAGLRKKATRNKATKGTKKCFIKRKLKFEKYKNCLEATQLENKSNHLGKNKINIDSFFCYKRNHKEFIKNNKLILKTQQRFKSERHNIFTEEINKTALRSNDDKRMQLFDSIETYAYGMRKDLVSEKDEIKCNNIIKQYKNN